LASPDCGAFPVSAIYEIALVVSIHASAREATPPSVHPHARGEHFVGLGQTASWIGPSPRPWETLNSGGLNPSLIVVLELLKGVPLHETVIRRVIREELKRAS